MESRISKRRATRLSPFPAKSTALARALIIAAALVAAACAPPSGGLAPGRDADRSAPQIVVPRPAYPGYGEAVGAQEIRWSAQTLADDFVQLMFFTEWGARADSLRRWEKPVDVALIGPELAAYEDYAAALVARLDAATPALPIALRTDRPGDITLRSAPRAAMRRLAPGALCFFAPHDGDLASFAAARAAGGARWAGTEGFDKVTIFIPQYAAPNEIRACIDEEIIQALGPGNDLARLEDSIYNDDNAHSAPTAFDLLMLSVLYSPEIEQGMDRETARSAAIEALTGPGAPPLGPLRRRARIEDDVYLDFYSRTAKARGQSDREKWADRTIEAARNLPAGDHRLGDAHMRRAYVAIRDGRRDDAVRDLETAAALFEDSLGPMSVRLADARAGVGIYRMQNGQPRLALAMLEKAAPVLAAHAQERDLAQTLRWRALALDALGRKVDAARAAREALDWAAYAFGGDSRLVADWRAKFKTQGIAP